MEFRKDSKGKITGEIKLTGFEAHDLYYALRYFKTHCLSDREDHYYDSKNGDFEANLMKGYNDIEEETNDRLIRQMELLSYELAPFQVMKDNYKRMGRTGAEE
tara:strand:- start:38 stop:346 length:309 start_codon:yes stop_codon:yes gene_type:complete